MATGTRSLLGKSDYSATMQQVSLAKSWARETVGDLVDEDTLYDLSLCTDELVDNGRKHGRIDGVISVALYVTDDTVRLAVTNESLGITVPHVTNDLLAEEGRGMKIVEGLAISWGRYEPDDLRQVVWCEFPRKRAC